MDADDMLTKTALEEMHTLLETFDTDVIYFPKKYLITDDGKDRGIATVPAFKNLTEPKFEEDSLDKRVQGIVRRKFWAPPWRKLVQRKLLIENEIIFPNTKVSDDNLWTYVLMLYARKILCVPNVVYIQRLSANSITRTKRLDIQGVIFWLRPIILGLRTLDNFMDKLEFFRQNPQYRYAVLEFFSNLHFERLFKFSLKVSSSDIYESVKKEFGKYLNEQEILVAQLITLVNTQQKKIAKLKEK